MTNDKLGPVRYCNFESGNQGSNFFLLECVRWMPERPHKARSSTKNNEKSRRKSSKNLVLQKSTRTRFLSCWLPLFRVAHATVEVLQMLFKIQISNGA
jgi:hypothetical protein